MEHFGRLSWLLKNSLLETERRSDQYALLCEFEHVFFLVASYRICDAWCEAWLQVQTREASEQVY